MNSSRAMANNWRNRLGRVPLAMSIQSKARRFRKTGLSYAEIGKALKISEGSAINACKAS